jgi:calcineurin-like phosphoesterase family protein
MPVLPAARPNLPSAVASEDKEKRHSVLLPAVPGAWHTLLAAVRSDDFLWLLGDMAAKTTSQNNVSTKHKKAGGAKTASLRVAR